MGVRRRLSFAAPLVLVACHHRPPIASEAADEDDEDDDEEEVASAPASIDAAPAPDAPPAVDAAPVAFDPDNLPPGTIAIGRDGSSCHNFDGTTHCNPPRTPPEQMARIIDVKVGGNGSTEITIDRGASVGIEKGDRGEVVGAGRRGSFVVEQVAAHSSRARLQLSRDEVTQGSLRVRIQLEYDP